MEKPGTVSIGYLTSKDLTSRPSLPEGKEGFGSEDSFGGAN